MKQFFLGLSVLAVLGASAQTKLATKPAAKPKPKTATTPVVTLKNATDSLSYALGMNIALNLEQQGITTINNAALTKAMDDVFKKRPQALSEQAANETVQKKMQERQQKMQEQVMQQAKVEKEKCAAFLAANAKRPGVITLPSGLQYEVLKKGDPTSAMPTAQDTVVAHYAGSLINGKEFDNSYKRGEPLTIPAGNVIAGWTEILQLMHIGDKFKVYIPSELGYGDRGAGADIPGGSTLIFDMELLGIKPAAKAAAEPAVIEAPKPVGQ